MTTDTPASVNPIAETRTRRDALAQQLDQARAKIAGYKSEIGRLDLSLASVTLASKPLEVLQARERRQQLLDEVRRLNSQLPPLEQELDGLNMRYSGWESKLEQARRLRAGVAGGTFDRRVARMDVGELKQALDRAAQLLSWAGEPCDPITIKL